MGSSDSLSGKVAVITGGASGIGLATARSLADRGCKLVLADIEQAALDSAAAELPTGTEVLLVRTDVSKRSDVDSLAAQVGERFGEVDILFLNAGVGATGPLVDATHDDWEWMIGVNLWGPIHGVEAFLPSIVRADRDAHIFFTASFAGVVTNEGLGPYSVTKYGVVALAETLKRELRKTPIKVSVLCPMKVGTNIEHSHRNRPADLGGPNAGSDVDFDDPGFAGRIVSPHDTAKIVVDAIGSDELYLFTHEECREPIARRFRKIDAAFETSPSRA
jgi:NAD(P)-dependent dehydrogenase (short-subunit alcohol dehydrogenase family)